MYLDLWGLKKKTLNNGKYNKIAGEVRQIFPGCRYEFSAEPLQSDAHSY